MNNPMIFIFRLDKYVEDWSLVIEHLGQRVDWGTGELSSGDFKSSYSLNVDHSPSGLSIKYIHPMGRPDLSSPIM